MKLSNLAKNKKLFNYLFNIINVINWAMYILIVTSVILYIIIRIVPNLINLSANSVIGLSPDNIIRFDIELDNISNTNINSVYSLLLLSAFIILLLSVFILRQLRRILQNVINEKPFDNNNAKYLLSIGYAVVASSLIIPVLKAFTINRIIGILNISNVNAVYTINIEILLLGLLIILLSAIFKYGTYLQQEYDSTL